MERKKIYIILSFILVACLFFSAGYYFGVKKGVEEINKKIDIFLEKSNSLQDENIIFEEEKVQNIKNENEENSGLLEENFEEKSEKKFGKINDFGDFFSDNSLQKFVNSKVSFNDKKYVPENLVKISSEFIVDTKGNQTVRIEANENLQEMGKKFFNETGEKIKVVSAYRSYEYQVGIKKGGCPDNLCAKAGFSEHQSGLALDFWSASNQKTWKNDKKLSEYFDWLNKNAHNFGFHNTYQKGLNIDGYDIEPWHWRYVGVNLATYLKENKLTFAEYYNSL